MQNESPEAASTFDRWFIKLENALNAIAAAAIMFLMFFAVYQVVGRKVFNAPIFGYIDWVEQIMIVFAFAGIAYCQRLGGHVRMELFIAKIRGRPLWLIEMFGVLIGLFIIGVLVSTSFDHTMRAYELGDSTINTDLPIWPAKAIIPISLAALWLRLFLQFVGYARLFIDPSRQPKGVPVIVGVEEEAAKEIKDALGNETRARG